MEGYNLLNVYLRSTERHPILTSEKEKQLFESFLECSEKIRLGRQEKDLHFCSICEPPRKEIAERNVRLVISIARHINQEGSPRLLDLIQDGNIGLMKAIDLFKVTKGYKFSTYASWWIKQAIWGNMNDRTMRIPAHIEEDVRRFKNLNDYNRLLNNKYLTIKEVQEKTKWTVDRIQKLRIHILKFNLSSLDITLPDAEESIVNYIRGSDNVEENVDIKVLKSKLIIFIEALPIQEKQVLIFVYWRKLSYTEVGKKLKLTRERIRQIHNSAVDRLIDMPGGSILSPFLKR